MELIYELNEEVLQMHSEKHLLYLGTLKEIVVISLRRKLQRKDLIKRRINLPIVKMQDEFTQIYNDNKKGQVDFVKFAMKDGQYPIIHSSKVEQRLITLNSDSPQLKDFYLMHEASKIVILLNNGALLELENSSCQQENYNYKLISEQQVKAIKVNQSNKLCLYQQNEIIVIEETQEPINFSLQQRFKENIQFFGNTILLHNTDGIICFINLINLQVQYIQLFCLNLQLISQNVVLYQVGNVINESNTDFKLVNKTYSFDFVSNFMYLNGQFYFRNGYTSIQKLKTISCCCTSNNSLINLISAQINTTYNVIALPLQMSPQQVISNISHLPFDFSDLLIYLHYNDQYIQILELLLNASKKKKQKIQNVDKILIHLLILKEEKVVYLDSYIKFYLQYLQILPQTDLIQQQIQILKNDLEKKPMQNLKIIDKCPICDDFLIKWTSCSKHKFMRCNITQIALKNQKILQCKICKLHAIQMDYGYEYHFNCKSCPVCGGEIRQLI